ncbi:LUD domain-containing protein [Paraclostridium sordellii]|uniref:LUD domain-containing protein n=1 Tax=Paraclostridium sordellii TaxID=1505 RepID=UPI0005E3E95D|nr:LUD domain-containing protein [Paeniclostridium sordellii]CEO09136.1 transcriptional regulators of sugar metabolism [[Clostridium] sordellii] [Paeniclostridium sordellii]CEP87454.1 transcriptional regulators of sugar metabolism [[Clostridium] sordellii] [Paeniclostridium sordellii]CEP98865.1 transcriptional regulators of sugar metabolism [[Clostridium] sordellii] [Paeniclostridium sordellii]
MDNNLKWVNEKKIERTIKALEKNNMHGYFVNSKEEILEKIKEIVNEGSLVSCGGSQTSF